MFTYQNQHVLICFSAGRLQIIKQTIATVPEEVSAQCRAVPRSANDKEIFLRVHKINSGQFLCIEVSKEIFLRVHKNNSGQFLCIEVSKEIFLRVHKNNS